MSECQTQEKRAPGDTVEDFVGQFHAHLDECETCREHPFDLCPIGYRLLTTPRIPYIQPGPLAHRLPNRDDNSNIVIFSSGLNHKDVAEGLNLKPASAGSVSLIDSEVSVSGESFTLGISSNPEDSLRIKTQLDFYDGC